jgi:hypothetical protein
MSMTTSPCLRVTTARVNKYDVPVKIDQSWAELPQVLGSKNTGSDVHSSPHVLALVHTRAMRYCSREDCLSSGREPATALLGPYQQPRS